MNFIRLARIPPLVLYSWSLIADIPVFGSSGHRDSVFSLLRKISTPCRYMPRIPEAHWPKEEDTPPATGVNSPANRVCRTRQQDSAVRLARNDRRGSSPPQHDHHAKSPVMDAIASTFTPQDEENNHAQGHRMSRTMDVPGPLRRRVLLVNSPAARRLDRHSPEIPGDGHY